MKVTSVEIHPALSSNAMRLSFKDPGRVGSYNVRGITGLDADEIQYRFYGTHVDGEQFLYPEKPQQFFEPVVPERDIVVLVETNPNYAKGETHSSLRDDVYRLVASSRTGIVQIRFLNGDDVVSAVSGFVNKVEATLFEQQPEIQITVGCEDPILRALLPVDIDVTGLNAAGITITDELSTFPHGFNFEIKVLGTLPDFEMGDGSTWLFKLEPYGGFVEGDRIYVSSEKGNKYVYMRRLGSDLQLADTISIDSQWPIIFPGENYFSCVGTVEYAAIQHSPAYLGV